MPMAYRQAVKNANDDGTVVAIKRGGGGALL